MEVSSKTRKGVVMIGMSGSGKSTLGKRIAKEIDYKFIDSDRLIEERKNLPLQKIVDSFEDKKEFIELERSVISSITLNQHLLSTGGSTCYSNHELQALGGTVVFLKISWSKLIERLQSFDGRGVILFHPTFKDEYEHRQSLYREIADVVIDCDDKSVNKLVDEIKQKLDLEVNV